MLEEEKQNSDKVNNEISSEEGDIKVELERIEPSSKLTKQIIDKKIQFALIELHDQIKEDSDIEEGKFIFQLTLCPKSEYEATMMCAKLLDSVINEDSNEVTESFAQPLVQN